MGMRLPKSWSEISIGQYQQIITILSVYKDPIEREVKLIAFLSGKTEAEIEGLTVKQITDKARSLGFLYGQPPQGKVHTHFKCKGRKYQAVILTEGMTAGQFIDFNNAGKGASEEELPYHMHELIACMCKTRKLFWQKWEYIPYDKTCDDLLSLPMTIAHPYFVFFCQVLINLQEPIQDYFHEKIKMSEKKLMKMTKKLKSVKDSQNTGDGTVSSTRSVITT
ncbi:MAG: hypothetical protein A2Z57_12045 [Planctomycetes bacterium RIFCSPHIGHO2_12_39_6]|nr:MAG: hypothetical protein A2Z57_12045 [Planctomycetes bacterium RIFCSPHIGHO2_12_39_6]